MRLLHLTDRLSARGGADWHLLGVLARLAPRYELLLAHGRDDGSAAAPCPTAAVPALGAPGRAPALPPVGPALDALAAAFRPDLVHVHNVMNPAALAWAAARGAVMTVQDHRAFCPGRGKLTAAGAVCRTPLGAATCAGCFDDAEYFARLLELTRARLAALGGMRRLIVLSRYMAGELAAAGLPADRLEVIPPFVHGLDPAAPPAGPPCVLFAGRLVAAKGVADAVVAWRAAATGLPLVVAGTGPERGRLAPDGVELLGWVPHGRLAGVYRRARALVFPSRWQEPFGIAGLEALTLGVPVAAWASGGVAEWHPGRLARWGDVAGLGAALGAALGQPAAPPPGFAAAPLMARLAAVYAAVS
jgi:glycosyltransferase involved in cell wall biosynthesis